MHDILISIMLGIVEGLTEFLPVSSTGHLLVAERLLGLGDDWEAFTVVIQLGAILAVVAIYFQTFWKALIGLPSSAEARRFALGHHPGAAAVGGGGLALKKFLDQMLLNPAIAMPFIAACWIVGGIIILVFERIAPKPALVRRRQAAAVEGVPDRLLPGPVHHSRRVALRRHHPGRRASGRGPPAATLFTFYLAVPTMLGATILELHHKGAGAEPRPEPQHRHRLCRVVCGGVFRDPRISAHRGHGLRPFGWYRIAAGLALIACIWRSSRLVPAPDRHIRPWRGTATDRTALPLPPWWA